MSSIAHLFRSLEPSHVIAAINQIDNGRISKFANAVKYNLIYQGKKYHPKEVAGIALENMTGQEYSPTDFSAGKSSASFRALARCGFTIVAKRKISAQDTTEEGVRSNKRTGKGQGRGLSHVERKAIELQAMNVARQELERLGFEAITDKSSNESYDFSANKDGLEWLVEVKGTTNLEGNSFLLTAAELRLHKANPGRTILIIVADIHLDSDAGQPIANGGVLEAFIPWDTTLWRFEPTSYQAHKLKKD